MKRRKAIAPQREIDALAEQVSELMDQVKQLRQAGPSHIQPDDHRFAIDPFPWELMLHHPGGHTDIWDSDNVAYWHPGYEDRVTGEIVEAGFKRIGGPVVTKAKIFSDKKTTVAGDGAFYDFITEDLRGTTKLVHAAAMVSTVGAGVTTIQIHNVTRALDMLSIRITIDAGKFTSYASAVPSEVQKFPATANPPNKVAIGDVIRYDVDTAGAGSKGLLVALGWQ